MTDISKLDVLYLDDDNYLSVQAMYPRKIVIPKSVYDHIANAIRRECATKASQAIMAFGESDKTAEWYSPMIRKELAAAIIMDSIFGKEAEK